MRKKRIEKKPFSLGLWSRIQLAFWNKIPKSLEESRHLFKSAILEKEPSWFWAFMDRLITGHIYMLTPVWIQAYQVWVTACGKDMSALKDPFNSTSYDFDDPLGNNPLRDIIMKAILPLIDLNSKNLHRDEPDAYYLVIGAEGHSGDLRSRSRQAALLRYCELNRVRPEKIKQISNLILVGTPAYRFATEDLRLKFE